MSSISLSLPDELRAQVETRAAQGGYASVNEYIETILRAEALGSPAGLSVDSDQALQSLVASRLDGPWVDADDADLVRIRAKFQAHLDREAGEP